MNYENLRLSTGLPLVALIATATLSACSPADKSDTNAAEANKTCQTVPADETGTTEDVSEVAREMHNRMNEDQAMHDSMKDKAMPDDQMDKMHSGGMNDPAMKGGAMKGMGGQPASDPAPKDKTDPMPMTDM
jgi:hypothetical protein